MIKITDEINDLLRSGIISPAVHAEYNLVIWKKVANEYEYLSKQDEYIQKAFGFMQSAAVSNFILYLSKVYDRPSKKHQTKCFERFLYVVQKNCDHLGTIPLTQMVIELLEKYHCPIEMIEAVRSQDSTKFFSLFCDYYEARYYAPSFQSDLAILRTFRDKAIAHNETLEVKIHNDVLLRLFSFAEEVYLIFDLAFNSRVLRISENISPRNSAEDDAYFVDYLIKKLKAMSSQPALVHK